MRLLSTEDECLGEAVAIALLPAGAGDWPFWVHKTLRDGLANFDTDSPAAVAHTAAVLWQRETGATGAAAWIDDLEAIATGRTEQRSEPRFKLLTAAVIAALPPMEWRIRGVLPRTGIGALYGLPGCGKSFLALDTLGAIAAGRTWFSHAVTAAPCVYLGLEGEAGVGQRIQAYTSKHGTPEALRVILSPLDIRLSDDRAELVEAIKGAGMAGGVLCLDTLNRAAPGADENDSKSMGQLIDAMKALQADLGGLVLAVHHSGKDQTRGLRGHSSLLAALDAVVEVTRQDDRREWRVVKSKDGEDGAAHPFRLDVVELGEDAEGYPITSCVVMPEQDPAEAVGRAKVPRGGNQRIVWDGLGELMRASSDFGQGDAPPSRPCVRLDDAIHALRGRLTCPTDRQTERTRQAVTGLIASGLIHHREGWLWTA